MEAHIRHREKEINKKGHCDFFSQNCEFNVSILTVFTEL